MKRTCILAAILLPTIAATMVTAEERLYSGGKWVKTAPNSEDTPAGRLVLARKYLAEQKPGKALKQAKKFLKEYAGDEGAEDALNIAGQAEMDRRHWWKAFNWYEKQVSQFPVGELYDRAMTREAMIAEAFLAGQKRWMWGFIPVGMTEDGLEILERVAERMPGTPLAERCLMRAADYLYDAGRWEEAADAYQRYGELFRGRYRSREAELKAAKATYKRFEGVNWDDTPLLEAEQRFRVYLARYPMAADREDVVVTLDQIENTKAKKDYEAARFYDRIGRKRASAYYDRQVVKLYPGTPWADKSAKALGEEPVAAIAKEQTG